MAWTRYDYMRRPELRTEIIKRKVKVYLNANSLQMRLALIQDDVDHGINPRLPHVPQDMKIAGINHDHSSSSPSDVYNPVLQQNPLASPPSLPSVS